MERLFQKFEDFYGAKWAAQYGAFPRDRVKKTWGEELAGFSSMPDCIADAIKAQLSDPRGFPPTLPEFLNICRDAARRNGEKKALALAHKLTAEDMERNRKRAAELAARLGRKMAGGES